MPTELTDMDVDEISLVGKGANQGARVVLMKQHEEATPYEALVEEFGKEAADELIKGLLEEDDMSDEVVKLSEEEVAFSKGMSPEDKKKYEDMSPEDRKKMMSMKKEESITKADLDTAIAKAVEPYQAQVDSLKSELAKRDIKDETRELQDELTKGHVPDAENVAKSLVAVPAGEHRDVLKKSFLAQGEQLAKADLFKEAGSDGDRSGNSALDELNELAKAAATKDSIPFTTAFSKVYSDPINKALVTKYKDERKGS